MKTEQGKTTFTEDGTLPVSFIPTPTEEYRAHRKTQKVTTEPGTPIPMPTTKITGTRTLVWKEDPLTGTTGIQRTYLPTPVLTGPRDGRISIEGLPVVSPNAFGDLIQTPGTKAFDAVHTFTVIRKTLTMFQRALTGIGATPAAIPWNWNSPENGEPIRVFPHDSNMINAYYSRYEQALRFGFFDKPGYFTTGAPPTTREIPTGTPFTGAPTEIFTMKYPTFTCRSTDLIAHQTGHAILDGLKPGWLDPINTPQTIALHETFADLSALFLTLTQFDQIEAIVALTKGNLYDKTIIPDFAEKFGLVLGRPTGIRCADNTFTMTQAGFEINALSQVFTATIYDILADIFTLERKPAKKDDTIVLFEAAEYLFGLFTRAIVTAPATGANFTNVVNQMLTLATSDGKPVQYRNFIRNRFVTREVVIATTPLTTDHKKGVELETAVRDGGIEASQDRRGCCGTLQHHEYNGAEDAIEKEIEEFKKALV